MRTPRTQSSSADLLIRSDHPRTGRKVKPTRAGDAKSKRNGNPAPGRSATQPRKKKKGSRTKDKQEQREPTAGDRSPYLAVGAGAAAAAAARHISCLFSPTPMAPPFFSRRTVWNRRSTTSPSAPGRGPSPCAYYYIIIYYSQCGLRWKTGEILVDQRSAAGEEGAR